MKSASLDNTLIANNLHRIYAIPGKISVAANQSRQLAGPPIFNPILTERRKIQLSSEDESSSSSALDNKRRTRTFTAKGSPAKKQRVNEASDDSDAESQGSNNFPMARNFYQLIDSQTTNINTGQQTTSVLKHLVRTSPNVTTLTNLEVFELLWQKNEPQISICKELFIAHLTRYDKLVSFQCLGYDERLFKAPYFETQAITFVNFVECDSVLDKFQLLQIVDGNNIPLIGTK